MSVALSGGVGGGGGGGGGGSGDPPGTSAALMAAHLAAAGGDAHAARSTQPSRTQSGNYTLALTDLGQLIKAIDGGTPQQFTIPAGIFAQYDLVYVRAYGTAGVLFVAGAGMTINSSALVLSAHFSTVALHFDSPTEVTLSPQLT